MAGQNAQLQLSARLLKKAETRERLSVPGSVLALQEALKLDQPPRRIETFDISNIQGSDPVASMVCFIDGKPRKSEYRKFKIKEVIGPNDFAMMQEVVGRRYQRILDEEGPLPDLVVIDGGKGQLSSAKEVLDELGLVDLPVIGLAKRLEEVFFPGQPQALLIPRTSPALKLLMQSRDEAHRFALTFHRQQRNRRTIQSEVNVIPGVGPKRAQMLLKTFGSVEKISVLSVEELTALKGVSRSVAQKIYDHFHPDEGEAS
jgi:excinuclease ABC subunit C